MAKPKEKSPKWILLVLLSPIALLLLVLLALYNLLRFLFKVALLFVIVAINTPFAVMYNVSILVVEYYFQQSIADFKKSQASSAEKSSASSGKATASDWNWSDPRASVGTDIRNLVSDFLKTVAAELLVAVSTGVITFYTAPIIAFYISMTVGVAVVFHKWLNTDCSSKAALACLCGGYGLNPMMILFSFIGLFDIGGHPVAKCSFTAHKALLFVEDRTREFHVPEDCEKSLHDQNSPEPRPQNRMSHWEPSLDQNLREPPPQNRMSHWEPRLDQNLPEPRPQNRISHREPRSCQNLPEKRPQNRMSLWERRCGPNLPQNQMSHWEPRPDQNFPESWPQNRMSHWEPRSGQYLPKPRPQNRMSHWEPRSDQNLPENRMSHWEPRFGQNLPEKRMSYREPCLDQNLPEPRPQNRMSHWEPHSGHYLPQPRPQSQMSHWEPRSDQNLPEPWVSHWKARPKDGHKEKTFYHQFNARMARSIIEHDEDTLIIDSFKWNAFERGWFQLIPKIMFINTSCAGKYVLESFMVLKFLDHVICEYLMERLELPENYSKPNELYNFLVILSSNDAHDDAHDDAFVTDKLRGRYEQSLTLLQIVDGVEKNAGYEVVYPKDKVFVVA